jgi:hypothetical protein
MEQQEVTAKHESSLQTSAAKIKELQSELSAVQDELQASVDKARRAKEALKCVKHELPPEVTAKVEKAPKQLQGLVSVLPYVDKRTLMLAMGKAAFALKGQDAEFTAWVEELEDAMRYFVGPPDHQQRYLQSCTFLLRQAQKAGPSASQKMEGSLRPLGFEDMHLQVLKETLAWTGTDEPFASFEVKYERSDLQALDAEDAEKAANAAASFEQVQAELEEKRVLLEKELALRQVAEGALGQERADRATELDSERAKSTDALSRAELAETELQGLRRIEQDLREQIEGKEEELRKFTDIRKALKADMEQEMEFQVGREAKLRQKAESRCAQLEEQLASVSSSAEEAEAITQRVEKETRLRQAADARCLALEQQLASLESQQSAQKQLAQDVAAVTLDGHADAVVEPLTTVDLEMEIADWLGLINCADCFQLFQDEGVQSVEDVTFLILGREDLASIGMASHQIERIWPHIEAAIGQGQAGEDTVDEQPTDVVFLEAPQEQVPHEGGESQATGATENQQQDDNEDRDDDVENEVSGDDEQGVRISLDMTIGAWLDAHGASQHLQALEGEDIETLEDLTFVVNLRSDLRDIGVGGELEAHIWDALVVAKKLADGESYTAAPHPPQPLESEPEPEPAPEPDAEDDDDDDDDDEEDEGGDDDSDDDDDDDESSSGESEDGFVVQTKAPEPQVEPEPHVEPEDEEDDSSEDEDDDEESSEEESSSDGEDDAGFIVAAAPAPATAAFEPEPEPTSYVTLETDVGQWLALHNASKHEKAFRDEDCETLEDVTMIIQEEEDFEELGLPEEVSEVLWRSMQEATAASQPGGSTAAAQVDMEMDIGQWLALHNASKHEKAFRDEDCDTLEDVTMIVQVEEDFEELGLPAEVGEVLWQALQAATGP